MPPNPKPHPHKAPENTTDTTNADEEEHPAQSVVRLPMELVLNISEYFLSQQCHWSLAKSPSGEPLWNIWNRLASGSKLENKDQTVKWMFYWLDARPFNIVSAMQGLYTYRPDVPAILQTNHTLRVKGLKHYLDCARAHIEVYESEHTRALEKYSATCLEYINARATRGMRGVRLEALRSDLGHQISEMAERCLRWFVLRESCMLLGARFEEGSRSEHEIVLWESLADFYEMRAMDRSGHF